MPAWRHGIAVGEWRAIPNTSLASAPMRVVTYPTIGYTGPESKVTAWNGFAIDRRDSSIYSLATGGHHDYAGNEVNRIRLSDNVPSWTEVRAATPPAQVIEDVTHYADGRPTSRHTYYGTAINEKTNRAMLFNGARYGNGYSMSNVEGFNLGTSDWDAAGTHTETPDRLAQVMGAAMTFNPDTGDLYAFGWVYMHRWDATTRTWSTTETNMDGQSAATALDTRRNRILLLGGSGNLTAIYDIASDRLQTVALSGPQAGSVLGMANGLVYDPLQDAFLLRKDDAGGDVYRINAQTLYVDKQPTGSAGSQIPATQNGVWAKFLYVPALKGVVYVPTYDGNVWFLRTY